MGMQVSRHSLGNPCWRAWYLADMADATTTAQSWELLSEIIASGNAEHLAMFVQLLPPEETAYTINQLKEEEQTALWSMLSQVRPEFAADLMEHFDDGHAADMLEELTPEAAAAIVDEMDSDEQTDLLAELTDADAQAILREMDPEEARDARERLDYDEDTAGGLMITEYLHYHSDQTIDSVIADLRGHGEEYGEYELRYLYITDAQEKLVGVVQLRSLLLAGPGRRLGDMKMADAVSVRDVAPLDELEDIFDRVDYPAIPVIDEHGVLCGVVRRSAVQEALRDRGSEDFLKFFGIIGGEELRSMSLNSRWARRLAFLVPSLILSGIAVSIIAVFEPIIEQLTVLAIFLPLVANLSGAAGNQAVAVSIRELALGLIMPRDLMRVVRKEILVGLINGALIGGVLVLVIWLMHSDKLALASLVGGAYTLNSLLAVCLGGGLPLMLKRMGVDPAMLSSPILTTLTDAGAFFLTLSFAALLLAYSGA
jgi:magnesium transporter